MPLNRLSAFGLALLALAGAGPAGAAITLPRDFVAENVTPSATWNTPVAIAYLPGGRLLVAEKRGRVYVVENGIKRSTPMLNIESEVLNTGDRGLLGLAVDPNHLSNRYVYLLYTVDPDSNNVETNDDAFGRLTRYQVSASDSNLLLPSSRTILMGVSWGQGPVSCSQSHTIGTLRFGEDGSLLVGAGDGASYSYMDAGGRDPNAFLPGRTHPYEDIGAFRSQSLSSLAGKILRLDPATGHGYPSNPFYDGNPQSVRSRVWAYGLRNPFRFCVEPGSGSTNPASGDPGVLHIGEVGWNRHEELNVVTAPGMNFGWPCVEGPNPRSEYQAANPAHNDCDSYGTSDNPRQPSGPVATWHHTDSTQSVPYGIKGNAAVGGIVYTGRLYPAEYRNKLFLADYGGDWIRVVDLDAQRRLLGMREFASGADAPVDFALEPGTGNLVYVSIATGQIRRIRYIGATPNQTPVAEASGSPATGVTPLAVSFSSAGSRDADQDPITFAWDFGDGAGSTAANPAHTYTRPGAFDAILTVSDNRGGLARDTVRIVVSTSAVFPVTRVLDTFNRPNAPLAAPWSGDLQGLAVSANALVQTCCAVAPIWNGASFGPEQEVFVRLAAVASSAPEQDLLLKVQGTAPDASHIEVRYDAPRAEVRVSTFTPEAGWVTRGGPIAVTFQAGDVFGARAYSNGVVEVFRNGARIGSRSVAGWPHAPAGGRIGLRLEGAEAARLDDFGGGTVALDPNTPPVASVVRPGPLSFYAVGDRITLEGTATDAHDPPSQLALRWQVDLHHNNHVHPANQTGTGRELTFVAEDHDDGTGVWFVANFIATDREGLADTASVELRPDVDLVAAALRTVPGTPGTTAPALYRFTIANSGRMPAPAFRWRLRAGSRLLAEGDTLVPARDSVIVERWLPPVLAAGSHVLRVAVDTLGAVVETAEGNNGRAVTLRVVEGDGPDEFPPQFTVAPAVNPGATFGDVAWETDEPSRGRVLYGTTPALGDSVASPGIATRHAVRIPDLVLGTLYYYAVAARDSLGHEVVSAVDTFTTRRGPLGGSGAPPAALELAPPWPNPSAGPVSLSLGLPYPARVRFRILDLQGRQLWATPVSLQPAGRLTLRWEPPPAVRSGVYVACAEIGSRLIQRRFTIVR